MSPNPKQKTAGFTLVEMIMAILIFGLVAGLSFSTLVFYHHLSGQNTEKVTHDRDFESLHLFFQRQIEQSEIIMIKDDMVYLQDMESPAYFNYYTLDTKNHYLYRNKTDQDLKSIGKGAVSQLAEGLSAFALQAEIDAAGTFTGVIRLRVCYSEDKEQRYEVLIAVPMGSQAIQKK